MTPVEPPLHKDAHRVVVVRNQGPSGVTPTNLPIPASIDAQGLVMTEWLPSADELDRLLRGGRIRLWVNTFLEPFPPVSLEAVDPDDVTPEES